MKKIITVFRCILLIIVLYLIYIYNIHNGWNKLEQLIIETALILGLISSIVMIYQKKRSLKEDQND
jgi:hypothetical protein